MLCDSAELDSSHAADNCSNKPPARYIEILSGAIGHGLVGDPIASLRGGASAIAEGGVLEDSALLLADDEVDSAFRLEVKCYGERFRPKRETGGTHSQGTEIKAVTKHEVRIVEEAGRAKEMFVLVDI